MLESRASPSPGTFFGVILLAGFVLLDVGLLVLIANEPVTLLTFLWGVLLALSFPAVAFLAFWISGLSETRYYVQEATLFIEWGRLRRVVSLAKIRAIVHGDTVSGVARFRGVRWPGCFVGSGYVNSLDGSLSNQETLFYSSRPLHQQVLIVTDSVTYGLSPIDLGNFIDCLDALRVPEMSAQESNEGSDSGFMAWALWGDEWALTGLFIPLLMNLALFAYLTATYGRLPVSVPLHFNTLGIVDRTGSPASLFVLPVLGLLGWMSCGLLGWIFYQTRSERPMAFLLWGASFVIQLVAWGGVIGLVI